MIIDVSLDDNWRNKHVAKREKKRQLANEMLKDQGSLGWKTACNNLIKNPNSKSNSYQKLDVTTFDLLVSYLEKF